MHAKAEEILAQIRIHAEESVSLARQSSEAYSATVSVGLGASFESRANTLVTSIRWWVVGLFAALCAGALVSYFRFQILSATLLNNKNEPVVILVELLVSILSVALPLWFAWMATKQIQERFKLSEDYAFKASVAKAYEGYRREAKKFDVSVEERLFMAVLQRLEEEPLRYADLKTHASPYHESGLASTVMDTALEIKSAGVGAINNKIEKMVGPKA